MIQNNFKHPKRLTTEVKVVKGQKKKRMSSWTKDSKRKMLVHCKSCEQMETSLLFSRPFFSICTHEL